jgi:hypothetical protein
LSCLAGFRSALRREGAEVIAHGKEDEREELISLSQSSPSSKQAQLECVVRRDEKEGKGDQMADGRDDQLQRSA